LISPRILGEIKSEHPGEIIGIRNAVGNRKAWDAERAVEVAKRELA
jgi:hypothetical protein